MPQTDLSVKYIVAGREAKMRMLIVLFSIIYSSAVAAQEVTINNNVTINRSSAFEYRVQHVRSPWWGTRPQVRSLFSPTRAEMLATLCRLEHAPAVYDMRQSSIVRIRCALVNGLRSY